MSLEDLLKSYKSYEANPDVELITRAYEFAEAAHVGEKRRSGLEFIKHPLAVTLLLADIQAGGETLAAALLHDVLEHTNLTKEDLAEEFGEAIADLVDGVSVIQRVSQKVGEDPSTPLRTRKRTEENLQKLLLATARDPRVLLIRMAEEVDNLKNLDAFSEEEQKVTLEKAFEIYSPLAGLLGIHVFKHQLEDLAFKQTNPKEFTEINQKIDEITKKQRGLISDLGEKLKAELAKAGIKAEVVGRKKHVYGVYQKLPRYAKKGKGVWFDVLGLRVITDKTEQCYQVLDIVRRIGRADSDLFDDYIAKPKANGYQSLHAVIWLDSFPAEIQIRTKKMHEVAEFGLAAHVYYKEKGKPLITPEEKIKLLRNLIGWEEEKKLNLFADKVFVFTPKADVIDLPKEATPIDFAFAVHTDLGRSCTGAKVNGKMAALDSKLQNGEVVEVITARGRKPSADWLKFVKTDLARSQIKKSLKKT